MCNIGDEGRFAISFYFSVRVWNTIVVDSNVGLPDFACCGRVKYEYKCNIGVEGSCVDDQQGMR